MLFPKVFRMKLELFEQILRWKVHALAKSVENCKNIVIRVKLKFKTVAYYYKNGFAMKKTHESLTKISQGVPTRYNFLPYSG